MPAPPRTIVEQDADALAHATARRVVSTLSDALAEQAVTHLALTGGGILEKTMRALRALPDRDEIDWRRVHVWWADERYVPADSGERNDGAAFAALLDALPYDPARVHRMPAADGVFGDDVDAAARSYAKALADAAGEGEDVPRFAAVLLGVGPDAHCASLFPGHPGTLETERTVIGVRDAPKPPPTRLSLTFRALDAAAQVWFVASGTGKADAVARALSSTDRTAVPSSGPRGREQTVWLIDRDAAGQLP
jgi:6-phosphogluconolactonase